jgi:hypothetical protein
VSTAVHWLTDGHAIALISFALPLSIRKWLGSPAGEAGSNVIAWSEAESSAVHWLADGHATAARSPVPSIVTGFAPAGDAGSNVTCLPTLSTAVQLLGDVHASPLIP